MLTVVKSIHYSGKPESDVQKVGFDIETGRTIKVPCGTVLSLENGAILKTGRSSANGSHSLDGIPVEPNREYPLKDNSVLLSVVDLSNTINSEYGVVTTTNVFLLP